MFIFATGKEIKKKKSFKESLNKKSLGKGALMTDDDYYMFEGKSGKGKGGSSKKSKSITPQCLNSTDER